MNRLTAYVVCSPLGYSQSYKSMSEILVTDWLKRKVKQAYYQVRLSQIPICRYD